MFAEQLRQYRLEKGLSQADLSEKLGITPMAVSKWERGLTTPDMAMMTRLADLFGVSLDELCGREAPENAERNIAVMTRAFIRLTPEEQSRLLAVGKAMFAYAFEKEQKK